MDLINFFNPLRYMSREEYADFWLRLFQTVFCGFWGKLLALSLFIIGLWFAIRRQRLRTAVIFYLLSFVLAYGGGVYKFLLKLFGSL